MPTKSILLAVANPQSLIDLTEALGAGWEVKSVASEADALAEFDKRSFDALLVDFNLSEPDASELLNQVLEKHPQTIRCLLAHEADLALVAAKVNGSPQILPKPLDPASVKKRIETEVNGEDPAHVANEASDGDNVAPVPCLYAEVLKALETPGVTNEAIGDMIARDQALTAELLKLTNSSYLGLPRNITSAGKAVELLGLETVKAVVTALQFLAEHKAIRTGFLSTDQIWQHSVNVAQIARDLVLFETKDRTLASQALTAGLLHDLGKVVLAKNFDDLYGRVQSLARKQPVPAWDIEKEMFGANHGEIGACLIGMWNMPIAIVDAAALHHEPPTGEDAQLTPLAAVHVANVLEHELRPEGDDTMVAPIINTPFLNQLGLLQRLPVWRAAFANHRSEIDESEAQQVEADQPAAPAAPRARAVNPLRRSAASRRGVTLQQPIDWDGGAPVAPAWRKGLVWAGAAAILFLFALFFRTQPEPGPSDPVYARAAQAQEQPSVFSSTPQPRTPASSFPEPALAVASSEPTPVAVVAPASDPDPDPLDFAPAPEPPVPASQTANKLTPAPLPESAATHSAAPTNVVATPATVPAPATTQENKTTQEFHLNGIIYVSTSPSAIVNGQSVRVGHQVNGATVVAITQTTVTLQVNGQRRTLELH